MEEPAPPFERLSRWIAFPFSGVQQFIVAVLVRIRKNKVFVLRVHGMRVIMAREILKKYKHNPAHVFLDDTFYMITAGTYRKIHHLKSDDDKKLLFEIIKEFCNEFEWILREWVILDNHYHLMVKSRKGSDLPKLLGKIHRKSAYFLKRKNKILTLHFWWNYWDTCVRGERIFTLGSTISSIIRLNMGM